MRKNKMKCLGILFLSMGLSLSLMSGCNNQSQEGQQEQEVYKGTIDVWSWNDELITSGIIDAFNEQYPDVNVNLITIPNDNNAYSTKLVATLLSGVCPPDVYLAEAANVKRFCNLGYYENLSEGPYNAEDMANNMIPYTIDLGRNDADHSIRALTWQATPGGYFYKRSLAKKYLGTDDPGEIQKYMSSMESFLELGEKIKEASNGATHLLANYSELVYVILGSREKGWVEDGKLVIDSKMLEYIDLASEIRSRGLDINASQWTPQWTEAMGDDSVFGFMLPTWGVANVLEANAPETKGDWAFVQAPTAYYWGGTWLGMYKDSDEKDLSWLFIKFITSNTEFMSQYAYDTGDFVNNLEVQELVSSSEEGNNAFVGGQNLYKAYSDLVGSVDGSTITQYDEVCNSKWNDTVDLYITGKISKEEVIPHFKELVKKEFKNLIVE